MLDQFENLYQDPIESFNASSPEILNFVSDDSAPGWYTPMTFILGSIGLCAFIVLMLYMTIKAIGSVSNREKNKKYVDFIEEYDTQGSWRDSQKDGQNELAHFGPSNKVHKENELM